MPGRPAVPRTPARNDGGRMAPVEIYTTRSCPYCISAKALLTRKGVAFKEIDVSGDHALRQEMIRRARGGMTVPQIFIGDIHVGGSDELHALERAHKLDPLLVADAEPAALAAGESP